MMLGPSRRKTVHVPETTMIPSTSREESAFIFPCLQTCQYQTFPSTRRCKTDKLHVLHTYTIKVAN